MNNYIYIAVMAAVSYTIRVLPLTLIRKPIKNQFIQSFLYYVPYVTLAVMTLPGHHPCYPDPHFRTDGTHCRYHRRMARCRTVSGIRDLLCAGVCDRIVCIMPCNKTRH